MKTKIFLALFVFSMLVISSGSFAAVFGGSNYCTFNGILPNLVDKTVEFNMLLEPAEHPNFYTMSNIVGALTVAPMEDLNNAECTSLRTYINKLLEFYKNNKNELQEKHPEIADALEYIKSRIK